MSNQEMLDGYNDGLDLNSVEPGENRSHSYRHGFLNGRDDRSGEPRASAGWLRQEADRCEKLDANFVEED